jgi:hypothetical protein
MISVNLSMTRDSSSEVEHPDLFLIRSTASVRTWLIVAHERFGKLFECNSRVSGKPARRLDKAAGPADGGNYSG